MDDNAPLSALAMAKLDDDIPLSALAAAPIKTSKAAPKPVKAAGKAAGAKAPGAAKTPGAAKPPGAAKVAVKGQAKAGTKPKKAGGSSSSSDSSSDSSDSSSEGGAGGKPKALKKRVMSKGKRLASLGKRKSTGDLEEGAEEEDAEDIKNFTVSKRDRSAKHQAVAELLCRWWYALPDWPPAKDDVYWGEQLEKKKLREVTIQEWEWVPEEDAKGFKKVYQLKQFRGCYRTSAGNLVDLRPKETCPCYTNYIKKEVVEVYELLVRAYEQQLKDLEQSTYNETKLKQEIQVQLTKWKHKSAEARSIGGPSALKKSKSM